MNKLASIIKFLRGNGHAKEALQIEGLLNKQASKSDFKAIKSVLEYFKMFGYEDPYTGDKYYSEGGYSREEIDELKETNISDYEASYELDIKINKVEKAFLLLGSILTKKKDKLYDVFNYLISKDLTNGLFSDYGLEKNNVADKEEVTKAFNLIYQEYEDWKLDLESRTEDGEDVPVKDILRAPLELGKYKTKDIIFKFDNGYTIVKIPSAEETEFKWPGADKPTSYDRVMEGNIMGTCLGSEQLLHQKDCEIYSLRDKRNLPHVTVSVEGHGVTEIKGKGNDVPELKYSDMIRAWLKTRKDLSTKDIEDFEKLPFGNIEDLEELIQGGEYVDYLFDEDLVSVWYGKSKSVKDYVIRMAKEGKFSVLNLKLVSEHKDDFRETAIQSALKIHDQPFHPNRWSDLGNDIRPDRFFVFNQEHQNPPWKVYRDEEWCVSATEKYLSILLNHRQFYKANAKNPFFNLGFYKDERYSKLITQSLLDRLISSSIYYDKNIDEALTYIKKNNFDMLEKSLNDQDVISRTSISSIAAKAKKFIESQRVFSSLIHEKIKDGSYSGLGSKSGSSEIARSLASGNQLLELEIDIFKLGVNQLIEGANSYRKNAGGNKWARHYISLISIDFLAINKIMKDDASLLIKVSKALLDAIDSYDTIELICAVSVPEFYKLVSDSGNAASIFRSIRDRVYSSGIRDPNGSFQWGVNIYKIIHFQENLIGHENVKRIFPEMIEFISDYQLKLKQERNGL